MTKSAFAGLGKKDIEKFSETLDSAQLLPQLAFLGGEITAEAMRRAENKGGRAHMLESLAYMSLLIEIYIRVAEGEGDYVLDQFSAFKARALANFAEQAREKYALSAIQDDAEEGYY